MLTRLVLLFTAIFFAGAITFRILDALAPTPQSLGIAKLTQEDLAKSILDKGCRLANDIQLGRVRREEAVQLVQESGFLLGDTAWTPLLKDACSKLRQASRDRSHGFILAGKAGEKLGKARAELETEAYAKLFIKQLQANDSALNPIKGGRKQMFIYCTPAYFQSKIERARFNGADTLILDTVQSAYLVQEAAYKATGYDRDEKLRSYQSLFCALYHWYYRYHVAEVGEPPDPLTQDYYGASAKNQKPSPLGPAFELTN